MKYIASILNLIDNIQSLVLKSIVQSRMTDEDKKLSDSALRRKMLIDLRKLIKTERIKIMIGFPLIILFLYLINDTGLSSLVVHFENEFNGQNLSISLYIMLVKFLEILFGAVFICYIVVLLLIITKKWRLKYRCVSNN